MTDQPMYVARLDHSQVSFIMRECSALMGGFTLHGQVVFVPTEEAAQGGDTFLAASSSHFIGTLNYAINADLAYEEYADIKHLYPHRGIASEFYASLPRLTAYQVWSDISENWHRYSHAIQDFAWVWTGWDNWQGVHLSIRGGETLGDSIPLLSNLVRVTPLLRAIVL